MKSSVNGWKHTQTHTRTRTHTHKHALTSTCVYMREGSEQTASLPIMKIEHLILTGLYVTWQQRWSRSIALLPDGEENGLKKERTKGRIRLSKVENASKLERGRYKYNYIIWACGQERSMKWHEWMRARQGGWWKEREQQREREIQREILERERDGASQIWKCISHWDIISSLGTCDR